MSALTLTEIFIARVQQAEDRAQPDRYGEWPGMPGCLQELGAYLASRNLLGTWRHSNRFHMTIHELQDMSRHEVFVGPGRAFAGELLACQAMGGDPMTMRFSTAAYEAIGEAEVAAVNRDEPVSWLFECFRRKPVLWETAQ